MKPELTSKKEADLWSGALTALLTQGRTEENAIASADALIFAFRERGAYGTGYSKSDRIALSEAETRVVDAITALRTNHFLSRPDDKDVHFTATELRALTGVAESPIALSKIVRKMCKSVGWIAPRTRNGRRGFVLFSPETLSEVSEDKIPHADSNSPESPLHDDSDPLGDEVV